MFDYGFCAFFGVVGEYLLRVFEDMKDLIVVRSVWLVSYTNHAVKRVDMNICVMVTPYRVDDSRGIMRYRRYSLSGYTVRVWRSGNVISWQDDVWDEAVLTVLTNE